MHIVDGVPLPLRIPLLRSLEVLALSTNDGVCFGDLVTDAVVLFRCRLPRFVILPVMSALWACLTPDREVTHEVWLGSGSEEVRHGNQVVMPYT